MYSGEVAGRASIVGAAETSVGKVREHNEDAHFIDPEAGIFIVCDGMGGHAAGEVASALAVQTIRTRWADAGLQKAVDQWLTLGTPDMRKQLIQTVQQGVVAAHDAIVAEAEADRSKTGMGTTLVGAVIVGADIVFAHCGDSRAYLVRDGIAMQLTEDHTLLARLLAAGVDVDVDGDGMRFKSMLTNALGIGPECKVSTFVVPLADGDRFLLCSDGITEYVAEPEVGEVLSAMPSPARAAQRLVEMALQRGGGDNATALVVKVLEAGMSSRSAEHLRRDEQAVHACPLWAKVNPQQRLRALRIAIPRDYPEGDKLPAQSLGDRVAWIVIDGELLQNGYVLGPGALVYPEALLAERPLPDKDGLAVADTEVRLLAIRGDDFRELCDDDPDLGEALLGALANEIAVRRPHRRTGKIVIHGDADGGGTTDPGIEITPPTGTPLPPRAKSNTDLGMKSAERAPGERRAPTEPPVRPSAPQLNGRGSEIESPKRLEPADDEDAEIVVEPHRDDPDPATEAVAGAVAGAVIEPLVAADSGPHHPRPKRQTDAPD